MLFCFRHVSVNTLHTGDDDDDDDDDDKNNTFTFFVVSDAVMQKEVLN